MAKTRKRNRRKAKTSSTNKNRTESQTNEVSVSPLSGDDIRTCVSGEKMDRSCHISPLHLISTTILTPSPILHHSISDTKLLELAPPTFRPRSRSSITTLKYAAPTTTKEISNIQIDDLSLLKTPLKRRRSHSFVHHHLTPSSQPSKRTRSIHKMVDEKSNEFFSPGLTQNIHNSTPKQRNERNIQVIRESIPHTSLTSIQSLSPIKKEPDIPQQLTKNPAATSGNQFQKFLNQFPSLSELYTWIGFLLKKSYASVKRLCSTKFTKDELPSTPASSSASSACQHCTNYKREMIAFNQKINDLTTDLLAVQKQIETMNVFQTEFLQFKQQLQDLKKGIVPPPPAPPPPPPPPPPPFSATPTSRPLKVTMRRGDSKFGLNNTSHSSRPLITVDEILKVRLRKTIPHISKPPPVADKTNEVFRVKLRPSNRPQTTGTSPRSSLARILKNQVDPSVRSVRRKKKSPFLSTDDISRNSLIKFREICGNDSAPTFISLC